MVVVLIFPKESYDLIGCAYAVFNKLKFGHQERIYQKAYATELKELGYQFQKEVFVPIEYSGEHIGKYFLDFLINNEIVIELKVANEFHPIHVKQVLTYLKSTNKKLGILILFTSTGIKYKRIVN